MELTWKNIDYIQGGHSDLDERNEKEETAPSEGFRAVTLPQ